MNESEIKKCPKCGAELENGVMQGTMIVFWNRDNIEEHLTTIVGFRGRSLESPAFRCKNCELLVFYYGKRAKRFI